MSLTNGAQVRVRFQEQPLGEVFSISVYSIDAEDPVPQKMVGHHVSGQEHQMKESHHPTRMLAWFLRQLASHGDTLTM